MSNELATANSQCGPVSFRDSSPDGLYGSILAIESALSVLLVERALSEGISATTALRNLRDRLEAMHKEHVATKYGTGANLIADGIKDSLDAIFRRSEEMLKERSGIRG